MVYGKYCSGMSGSGMAVAVGGTGVGVIVSVAVGKKVGVLSAGWEGMRVGSISIAGWFRGVQATMMITRQKDSSFFLYMDSTHN